jgi:hypothetical protein
MPLPPGAFSVANILGKSLGDARLEDEYTVDRQIGKGAFGVVRLVRGRCRGADAAVPLTGARAARHAAVCRSPPALPPRPPPPPPPRARPRPRPRAAAAQGHARATGEPVAVKSISKAKLVCKEDVKDVQAEVAIMNLVGGHQHVVTLKARRLGRPGAAFWGRARMAEAAAAGGSMAGGVGACGRAAARMRAAARVHACMRAGGASARWAAAAHVRHITSPAGDRARACAHAQTLY